MLLFVVVIVVAVVVVVDVVFVIVIVIDIDVVAVVALIRTEGRGSEWACQCRQGRTDPIRMTTRTTISL